jgi:hypothetical protein
MKSRKQIISESIADFIFAAVPPHQQGRFRALTNELEKAERRRERKEMRGFTRSLSRTKRAEMIPILKKLRQKGIL